MANYVLRPLLHKLILIWIQTLVSRYMADPSERTKLRQDGGGSDVKESPLKIYDYHALPEVFAIYFFISYLRLIQYEVLYQLSMTQSIVSFVIVPAIAILLYVFANFGTTDSPKHNDPEKLGRRRNALRWHRVLTAVLRFGMQFIVTFVGLTSVCVLRIHIFVIGFRFFLFFVFLQRQNDCNKYTKKKKRKPKKIQNTKTPKEI